MFISTLMTIPWIIFGFKNPNAKFLGLNQTKKSILTLLIVEITYWTLLCIMLGEPNPDIAGSGSFAWIYAFFYEKGIFPCFMFAELIHPRGGDIIDSNYQFMYLVIALFMDYLLLKVFSPRVFSVRPKIS